MSEPTGLDLTTPAAGILADLVAAFTAAGVELPTRRYIGPGAPGIQAVDCEQLVVCLLGISEGIGADAAQPPAQVGPGAGVGNMRYATWSVQLWRCVPVADENAELPPAEDIQEAGLMLLKDAGVLSQAVVDMVSFPRAWRPVGGLARAGGVASLGPQGGLAGHEVTLSLSVTATP